MAARIAKWLNISNLGKSVIPTTHPEKFVKVTKESQRTVEGKIVHLDRFGNIVTNILFEDGGRFKGLEKVIIGKIQVRDFKNNPSADGQKIKSRSIHNGDAAQKLKVKVGSPVKLVSYEKK